MPAHVACHDALRIINEVAYNYTWETAPRQPGTAPDESIGGTIDKVGLV